MVGSDRPVVAVWRNLWLPPTETFIRDHLASLTRWRALPLGLFEEPSTLDAHPVRAPFARHGARHQLYRVSRRTGYAGVYGSVLRRSRPSLVHAHFGVDAVDVLPVAKRHRLPLVVTFHGYDVLQAPAADAAYPSRLLEVFEYASVLLAVSDFLRTELLGLGAPADKVRVHYLGIPLPPQLADPDAERRGVVFVGRLIERKGVADLLEAYGRLPLSLRRDHPLTVIGDGPERDRLERLAAGLDGTARLVGVRSPTEVRETLSRARVFVGPSKRVASGDREAFGLTFIEAALAGLPVLGYGTAGVREAVVADRTGLLGPEGDIDALAANLDTILTDEATARAMGRAGQRRVIDEFDIARRTPVLEALYDQVAGDPHGVHPSW